MQGWRGGHPARTARLLAHPAPRACRGGAKASSDRVSLGSQRVAAYGSSFGSIASPCLSMIEPSIVLVLLPPAVAS